MCLCILEMDSSTRWIFNTLALAEPRVVWKHTNFLSGNHISLTIREAAESKHLRVHVSQNIPFCCFDFIYLFIFDLLIVCYLCNFAVFIKFPPPPPPSFGFLVRFFLPKKAEVVNVFVLVSFAGYCLCALCMCICPSAVSCLFPAGVQQVLGFQWCITLSYNTKVSASSSTHPR